MNQETAPKSQGIKHNLNQRKLPAFIVYEDETL